MKKCSWACEIAFDELKTVILAKKKNREESNNLQEIQQKQQENKKNFLKKKNLFQGTKSLKAIERLNQVLEDAALSSFNYWSALSSRRPEITKLYKQMMSTINKFKTAERTWHTGFDIYKWDFSAKKNYGIFLKNILMEKTQGKKMIKEAIVHQIKSIKNRFHVGEMYYGEDLSLVSAPICVITQNLVKLPF